MEDNRSLKFEKTYPWCLGRIPNLFDINIGAAQQSNGSFVTRSRSDISTMNACANKLEDKMMVSESKRAIPKHKANGIPMKTLIAQEMSKDVNSGISSPNLIARLMGLDSIPNQQNGSVNQRNLLGHHRCHSEISISHWEQQNGILEIRPHDSKDASEVWIKTMKSNHKDRYGETGKHRHAAFIHQKFVEANRMSMEEKHRHSKQFLDTLEVPNSKKDYVKCLEEPRTMLSQYNLQLTPLNIQTKRVTVLRPKYAENNLGNVGADHVHEAIKDGYAQGKCLEERGSTPPGWKSYEYPDQPTRIIVLRPNSGESAVVFHGSDCSRIHDEDLPRNAGDSWSLKSKAVAEAISGHSPEALGRDYRGELLTSVFSDGYVADDTPFSKSDTNFPGVNITDSELASSAPKHGSPYSSSYNRVSDSPESSVYLEAKKRLSERWSRMASNEIFQERRLVQKSVSTLGEMLALSETKKTPVFAEPMDLKSLFMKESKLDEHLNGSSLYLDMSKSIPVHPAPYTATQDSDKEKTTYTDESRTLRGNITNLFFLRNKTSSKDKHLAVDASVDRTGNCLTQGHNHAGTIFLEANTMPNTKSSETGISNQRPISPASPTKNQDTQSPVSVLDTPFGKNDQTAKVPGYLKLERRALFSGCDLPPNSIISNLIHKSPPIGSTSCTSSCSDSHKGKASTCPVSESKSSSGKEEAEEEWPFFLNTLLSVAGLQGKFESSEWHSPESPLDPSLRDKYMNPDAKGTLPEAKRRHKRSMQKLVFDCVNAALMDISCSAQGNSVPCNDPKKRGVDIEKSNLSEDVVSWFNKLFDSEIQCGSDESGVEICSMVEKEVVGQGWSYKLKLEMDYLGTNIGWKLMEELVEETLLELMGK